MTSWVSNFLDLVPIVGTVKNTVEAVSALCHGDTKLAAEKGLEAVVGGVLDVATLGVGSVAERVVVKGIERGGEELVGKTVAKQLSKDAEKVVIPVAQALTVAELAQLRMRLGKAETEEKGKEKEPSRRGEHVINNNILKFFRSVVEDFMSRAMPGRSFEELVSRGKITPNMRVYESYNNPLTPPYQAAVQKELVAHMDKSYIDANSVVYGVRVQQVRGMVVSYMLAIYHDNHSQLPQMERHIIEQIEEFIAGEYFVDEYALKVWLTEGGTTARYEDVKAQVVQMFRRVEYHNGNDEVIQWVRELKQAISQ